MIYFEWRIRLKVQTYCMFQLAIPSLYCVDSLTTITDDVTIVNPYEQFSHACSCYDMMPDSIKMVVLDKRLPMRKAFFALVQNGE